MVKKIRPVAEVAYSYGNDGRDDYYYIEFYCPTCGRRIRDYESDNACDRCGTFYDWGCKRPKIVIERKIEWPS